MKDAELTDETSGWGAGKSGADGGARRKPTPKPVRSYHLVALFLMAAFVAQLCWFVSLMPISQLEADQVQRGVALLRHFEPTAEPVTSPLVPLLSVAGIVFRLPHSPVDINPFFLDQHRWFLRMPFMLAGVALGLSLWYVARRFYGVTGGLVTLALFAFSPGMIARSAVMEPHILAAWGAFGLVFTALATAHTLYAPREVIFWNWKRIALVGIAFAVAVGAQWPLLWLVVLVAALMLWVVPHRRAAALLILGCAVAVGAVLLDVLYFGNLGALGAGALHALWTPQPISLRLVGPMLGSFFFNAMPGTLLLFFVAFAAWCVWRRARFFGNTAPLLVFGVLLAMAPLFPQSGASAMLFATLPFLLLFVAGVMTDLIQSRWQAPAIGLLFAIVFAQAAFSIIGLVRIFSHHPAP
jgi:hypothetical protein